MAGHTERVVILVDMDCFYCQVEEKLDPKLEGKPIAVVQYNAWNGGLIIAVNYPAREKGVTRGMRGSEAKKKCPDIILARVPDVRGKADLTKYRNAGKRVADVLQTFTILLERASVDEAYLDVTEEVNKRLENGSGQIREDKLPNTFVVGSTLAEFLENLRQDVEFCESNIKLAVGGIITEEIRAEVFKKTGYRCSAGIAHNKILAKLVCGLHKPNKQTVLPQNSVSELYKDLPIRKIKSLGGKFGNLLAEKLQISNMGELIHFSEKELIKKFDEKTGKWLYNIARGIDLEPVTTRLLSKSIGCCKKFPGKTSLKTPSSVVHWTNELATEIFERLEKDRQENNRRAHQMVISFSQKTNGESISGTRTHALNSYEKSKIAQGALDVLRKFCLRADDTYHITFLGISVGNFQDLKTGKDITSFFKHMQAKKTAKSSVEHESVCDISTDVKEPAFSGTEDVEVTEKTDDCSVYSASTEELDEDTASLIYYQDVCSEAESIKPVVSGENVGEYGWDGNDSRDKIVDEERRNSSKSFFMNYFKSEDTRNLDTFSEAEVAEATSNPSMATENCDKRICLECNRQIFLSEFVSHTDYHFALKMVKDEAHLYKVEQQAAKRKLPEPKTIATFFQQEETLSDDGDGETCIECNKRIKLEEIESHMDYHAAKKLHQELNSAPRNTKYVSPPTLSKSKGKKLGNNRNAGSLTAFLAKRDI